MIELKKEQEVGMAKVKIAEIPGKFHSVWDDEIQCVIDSWENFEAVSVDDLKSVLGGKVIPFVREKHCDVHIVDNTRAIGAFSPEAIAYLKTETANAMLTTSIRYFVTILSKASSIANVSMRSLKIGLKEEAFYAIEANTIDEALAALEKVRFRA